MLYVASQGIQELFGDFFKYKNAVFNDVHYLCEDGIVITVFHHLASLVMSIGDPRGGFLSHPHTRDGY